MIKKISKKIIHLFGNIEYNGTRGVLKVKSLRFLALLNQKKEKKLFNKLTEEQKFVYDISIKLLSYSNSILESSPLTGILYIKNKLKLLIIDSNSIHLVNGKFTFFFNYDEFLINRLKRVFSRHKQIMINNMVKEVSAETTTHLKNIYNELNTK
jgi:hypothetical protein